MSLRQRAGQMRLIEASHERTSSERIVTYWLRWLDALDSPPLCERASDLGLRDAPRAPSGRLVIAEAEHEVAATCPHHATKALDERAMVLVNDDVK